MKASPNIPEPVILPGFSCCLCCSGTLKVECALNIMVSIHDLFNKKLSHLARLDEQNGLCGPITAINSLARILFLPV